MKYIKTYEILMSKDLVIFATKGNKIVEGTIDISYNDFEELKKLGFVKITANGFYIYKKEDEEKIKKHLEIINSEYYKIAPKYNL